MGRNLQIFNQLSPERASYIRIGQRPIDHRDGLVYIMNDTSRVHRAVPYVEV